MAGQGMPAKPPAPNAAQRKVVIDPSEFVAEDEEPEGLYVEFRYHDPGEDIDPIVIFPGREVTVFAADGAVVDSQDFG